MPRIAFLVSSAREIDLEESPGHPTGYWAEEALTSYERLAEAGADVVVMTVDGQPPHVDPYSLEPIFHFPDEDRDYFASVYRSFHTDPDDIRVTLHHSTELELMAARRSARRLVLAGRTGQGAYALVRRAAKLAWQQDRRLTEVMLSEGLDGGLGEASLRAAVSDLDLVCQALADDRKGLLDTIDGFQSPLSLAALSDEEMGSTTPYSPRSSDTVSLARLSPPR